MTISVVFLGGGGHASDLLTAIESSVGGAHVVVADDADIDGRRFVGRADVFDGNIDDACGLDATFLAAIGFPPGRVAVVARADGHGVAWHPAVVHDAATVHPSVSLADGVVVLGRTWVSAHVDIGRHANIGYGVTIGHDTTLGEFAAVMPAASIGGDVTIGDRVVIGANATVLQGRRIGDGATVGAGAVVTHDVAADAVVVGVPARQMTR